MRGAFGRASRAPLVVAALLATPLFFAALMAASLAVERPDTLERIRAGRAVSVLREPSAATEAEVWLLALAPAALLVLAGLGAMLLRYGVLLVAAVAAVLASALTTPLARWEDRHTGRFPTGVDRVPDTAPGSTLLRGEWESFARDTATDLARATLLLAAVAAVIVIVGAARRRRAPARPSTEPPAALGASEAALRRDVR